MYTKEKPFKDVEDGAIASATFEGNRPTLSVGDAGDFPPELAQLIEDCWAKNPAERPGFSRILIRLRKLPLLSEWGLKSAPQTISGPIEIDAPL